MQCVILGGGNIGDAQLRLERAEELIAERIGVVTARSEWHKTEPWGFECSESFTNIAWVVETALSATEMLESLLQIEVELGRDRKAEYLAKVTGGQNYASRVIDLDILLYGDTVTVTPHLQVPHPKLLERDFAMVPMCQALGVTVKQGRERVMKIIEHNLDNEI